MLSVKIDAMQLNKTLNNVVDYSDGFLKGIDMKSIEFNNEVANFTHAALNKYIDSQD